VWGLGGRRIWIGGGIAGDGPPPVPFGHVSGSPQTDVGEWNRRFDKLVGAWAATHGAYAKGAPCNGRHEVELDEARPLPATSSNLAVCGYHHWHRRFTGYEPTAGRRSTGTRGCHRSSFQCGL
jgi:hypothetical protein